MLFSNSEPKAGSELIHHNSHSCSINSWKTEKVFDWAKGLANILVLMLCVTVLSSLGCGPDHPETGVVTGQVTVDGSPLSKGLIQFTPHGGRMAKGQVIDGAYSLRTFGEDDGALLGNHVVTVTAMEIMRNKKMPKFEPPPDATPSQIRVMQAEMMENYGGRVKVKWLVPEKYAEARTSPLRAEVKSGENEINFPIKTK